VTNFVLDPSEFYYIIRILIQFGSTTAVEELLPERKITFSRQS
jgi:hypothetical protein